MSAIYRWISHNKDGVPMTLMTAAEVHSRLENNEDPALISLEKYTRLVLCLGRDEYRNKDDWVAEAMLDAYTCPLCAANLRRCDKCRICLAGYERCGAGDKPYQKLNPYRDLLAAMHKQDQLESLRQALHMVAMLIDVIRQNHGA